MPTPSTRAALARILSAPQHIEHDPRDDATHRLIAYRQSLRGPYKSVAVAKAVATIKRKASERYALTRQLIDEEPTITAAATRLNTTPQAIYAQRWQRNRAK